MLKKYHLLCYTAIIAIIYISCQKEQEENAKIDWISIFKSQQSIIKSITDSNYYIEPSANIKVSFKRAFDLQFSLTEGKTRIFEPKLKSYELIKTDNHQTIATSYSFGDTKRNIIIDPVNVLKPQTSYTLKITITYDEVINVQSIPFKDENGILIEQIEELTIVTGNVENAIDCKLSNITYFKSINISNNALDIKPDTYMIVDLYHDYSVPIKVKRGDSAFFVKAMLSSSQLINNTNSQNTIDCSIDTSTINKIIFKPASLLLANNNYTFSIKFNYFSQIDGKWKQLYDENNTAIEESHSITFTTTNTFNINKFISYTYPIDKQLNFYKGEYPRGYLLFNKDMAPYFKIFGITSLQAKFSLSPDFITSYTEDITYDATDKTAWFNIPAELVNNKIYKLEIINNSQPLYTMHFRCSNFNKISEKFTNTLNAIPVYSLLFQHFQINLQKKGEKEYLDLYEVNGYNSSKLLVFRPDLDNTLPYTSEMKYLYERYSHYVNREKLPIGIPPMNNLFTFYHTASLLSQADISDGDFTVVDQEIYLFNKLTNYLQSDFDNIATSLYIKYEYSTPSGDSLIDWALTNRKKHSVFIQIGNYPFYLDYVLPGKNITTSTTYFNLNNSYTYNY